MRIIINLIVLRAVLITVLTVLIFNIIGCKPQYVVTEKESSALLEFKDSLMIKESDIALINTVNNRFIDEGFSIVNEMVIHEVEYDNDCRVSLERFINSSTKLEKASRDYEFYTSGAAIESSSLAQRSNSLQIETEGITKEESKQRNNPLSFKAVFVVSVVLVVAVVVFLFR